MIDETAFYKYEATVPDDKKKKLGIVYTSLEIVNFINREALSKWTKEEIPQILDPCCGTGIFLWDMAKKISQRWKISYNEACKHCFGIDIDKEGIEEAKRLLPYCNFQNKSSLFVSYNAYDIIVTNPPYVRIQNLEKELRIELRNEFSFCRGDTDIYMAFFQKFAEFTGIVGMITSNSWIRNKNARSLTNFLIENTKIDTLVDFEDAQKFGAVSTYTSIVIMTNKRKTSFVFSKNLHSKEKIAYDKVKKIKSFVFRNEDEHFLDRIASKKRGLFELCDIHVGLATLADSVYFLEVIQERKNFLKVKSKKNKYNEEKIFLIEKEITRKCIKASDITKNVNKTYVILFPYTKNDFGLIEESELSNQYPLAYAHLCQNKQILIERDKGKFIEDPKNHWWQYGRSQGIKTLKDKLLFAPFIKNQMMLKSSNNQESFISGYAIIPKDNTSLATLEQIFKSIDMQKWIKIHGKKINNGWMSVCKNTFVNYRV